MGRYKFVWALLRKYPGIFSGMLMQHFVKRRPFRQSANPVQNTKVELKLRFMGLSSIRVKHCIYSLCNVYYYYHV